MREQWRETNLGEITTFASGYAFPIARQGKANGMFPFIKVSDMNSPGSERIVSYAANWVDTDDLLALRAKTWPPGTVIFPKVGAALLTEKRRILGVEAAFDNNVMGLVPDANILPDYLYASLCQVRFGELAQQGAVPSINQSHVSQVPLLLPSLAEQRRIVDLIGALDAQITALADEVIALRRLFDHVLLTAIHGALEEAPPMLVALRDCLSLDLDRVAVRSADRYRMVGVLNQGKGLIDRGSISGDETGYGTLNRLRAGQLVMRKLTAWEGPIAVVSEDFDGCFASGEFPTFTANADLLSSDYLAHLCRWPGLWHEMKQRVTGSVERRKRLSPDQLLDVTIALPALPEQKRYAASLDALLALSAETEAEVEACGVLRNVVLPRLLSSESKIPESYDALLADAV